MSHTLGNKRKSKLIGVNEMNSAHAVKNSTSSKASQYETTKKGTIHVN
jgi:hypothetical protein